MEIMKMKGPIQAEETLQLALEAADMGIWDFDVRANDLRWSRRCQEIFGVSGDAGLKLEGFFECVHPEDREIVQTIVRRALDPAGSGQYDIEYRLVRPTGEIRSVAAKGRAIFEPLDGISTAVRFIGTILDHTEQKKAHEALLQSEKLALTGRLAASIAHEINNPLGAITDLLYLLREEQSETLRAEYLARAEAELAEVSDIARNTLRFYRDPVGIVDVSLFELIHSVLGLFHGRLAMLHVHVQTQLEDQLTIKTAPGELRQVVANLVANALDAMRAGGHLTLRAKHFSVGRNGASGIRLTIADTGHGMTPEVLKRIFEAFYTTKGSAGTGLGLWLSLEIIRKAGWAMRVKSAPSRGTVFVLWLNNAPAAEHSRTNHEIRTTA
jgi:PAS domain S-box-containing protein